MIKWLVGPNSIFLVGRVVLLVVVTQDRPLAEIKLGRSRTVFAISVHAVSSIDILATTENREIECRESRAKRGIALEKAARPSFCEALVQWPRSDTQTVREIN